ncbi:MAG: histidine phosphatase family protein [Deltaproteobacteria bacterium]|nr:histidine phosphatase family protein [Deltaproteobacteria bacterium]
MTRIVLVRHGQTEWNRVERFRGLFDVPLNEAGVAQAEATGRRVASEFKPAAVYSSVLARAARTAEAVAGHFGLPVDFHRGLADIDYGQWQGLAPEEARERWPVEAEAWYGAPHEAVIPGGETLAEVRARALAAVAEVVARHPGETLVLVSHTVVNRLILLGILGLGNERFWRLRQDTCAIKVFEALDGDFTLVSLNDTCHLRFSGEVTP